MWRMAKSGHALLVISFIALVGAPARAQTAPNTPPMLPPPAAPPPSPAAPIEPITGPTNGGPTDATMGSGPLAPAPLLTPTPAAPADAPLLTAPASPESGPFYTRWWFWTAVGAAAVTTIAILIATSGSSPPHTDFGNMPAF